ncbi:hypothetical protein HY448_02310 [Candidatus Pacearchaeota archaeon]|nr:hypothetical protein [Candidatus Pacearchaeota archaeon]
MAEYKTAELGNLLNESQIRQLTEIANKDNVSLKQIKDILMQDDSKWKGILIPDYFAYVILSNIQIAKSYPSH